MSEIDEKLTTFRKKYYFNLFVRGSLLSLTLILLYFLIATVLEYALWLSGWARLVILLLFFGLVVFSFLRFLKDPIRWWLYRRGLGKEESARIIGAYFPNVSDRLVNLIQLSGNSDRSALTDAGIAQKSRLFENISFEHAIDLSQNKRYVKYLSIPFLVLFFIFIIDRGILTQSTQRIVQFNREFSPEAPFQFHFDEGGLKAFFNEDYVLQISLEGNQIPEAVYLVSGNQRLKLESSHGGFFSYTFEKLQHEVGFQLEASGYYSEPRVIRLVNRPELIRIRLKLDYPRYLGKRNDEVTNSGNLEIPEGTKVTWFLNTSNARRASIRMASAGPSIEMQLIDDQLFAAGKDFRNSGQYSIDLQNEHSKNKEGINYSIVVLKDQFPQIEVDHVKDSVLYKVIFLGGNVRDDYGLTELVIQYELLRSGQLQKGKINIPISKGSQQQSFFYQWALDSLALKPGDRLDYFLQVWDNDGINGRKTVRSSSFAFALPSEEELKHLISKSQQEAESRIEKSLMRAKDVRQAMDDAQQKLKGKQVLDWQDKKMLDNILEQKRTLDQMISDLQKQNELLEKKKDAFSEQNEKIREKAAKIQKLMDELLDPETRKLFNELEKLLKESSEMNQVQKMLEKINHKEINLEKELERTLDLFKQLQLDYKVDQVTKEIGEVSREQEKLLEKTEKEAQQTDLDSKDPKPQKESNKSTTENEVAKGDKSSKEDPSKEEGSKNELSQQQESLKESFEKSEKKMEEIEQLSEELGNHALPPDKSERDGLKQDQNESKKALDAGQPKKAASQQKKALSKLREMEKQMQSMQSEMQSEIDTDNLEMLRQIVHGMIKLSFDQEGIMKEFSPIQQSDPKYIELSQKQLRIQEDAKVLEDSLLQLSKQDAFLSNFVTREIGTLESHLEKAADHIKERRKPNASSEMQLSMASINNLANMLNDHYEKTLEMLANAKGSPGKGKKKGQALSQMQMELNQRIQDLQRGKQTGQQFSEELAKAAAEQERIRRALQEMQEKLKQEGGKIPGGDIPGKMEDTEMDLVNKQITEKTIQRQKEIEVRLLEAEKSMKEQNQDEERKGESAREYDNEIPRAFEEYLRLKEKEVELLKTVPPKLYPYYKKEVNDYFKRIGNP